MAPNQGLLVGTVPLLTSLLRRTFKYVHSIVLDVQMDRTLSSEQKRIDFRPPEDLPPPLDRPTDACLSATALLTTAAKSVQQLLQGSNGSAFTSEVRQARCLASLLQARLTKLVCIVALLATMLVRQVDL